MYNMSTMLKCYYKHRKNLGGYIIGYIHDTDVYMIVRKNLPLRLAYIDTNTGNLRLRYKKSICDKWQGVKIGTVEDLYNKDKYNRGYNFEILVYKYYGLEWDYDNIPWYQGNDITINDIGYSIKLLCNCTLCKYTTVKRLNSNKA